MHGHQLHPGAVGLGHLDLEAALALLGGVEVGEEGQQAGVLAGGDELLGDLDQPVDVEQRVGRPTPGRDASSTSRPRERTTAITRSGSDDDVSRRSRRSSSRSRRTRREPSGE